MLLPSSDVLNNSELKQSVHSVLLTNTEAGYGVFHWRELLYIKNTESPGIRSYHNFLTVKAPRGAAVMKVHCKCYEGTLTNLLWHVKQGSDSELDPSS